MSEKNLIIGIDPDLKKNGVAVYNKETKHINTYSLKFFEVQDFIKENKDNISKIRIECGFLNRKSSWHYVSGKSQNEIMNKANRISKNVGHNEGVSKLLLEMCEHIGIVPIPVKPLKKIWSGSNNKITAVELKMQLDRLSITHSGANNSETRDACLIALF